MISIKVIDILSEKMEGVDNLYVIEELFMK